MMNLLPNACLAPASEHCVHGLPLGKIERQLPPLTARADHVQDGIEDGSSVDRRTATLRWFRQQESNQLPLLVGQVAGIMLAHHYGSVFLDLIHQGPES